MGQAAKLVTAIVLISTRVESSATRAEVFPDDELDELARALTEAWEVATVSRGLPDLWMWTPLVESGEIATTGLQAVLEVDLPHTDAERAQLRGLLRKALARHAKSTLGFKIIWANQLINFTTESWDAGASAPEVSHGYEEDPQGGQRGRRADEGQGQG